MRLQFMPIVRRVAVLASTLMVLLVLVPTPAQAAEPFAPYQTCQPNDDKTDVLTPYRRCVNGVWLRSRARLAATPACVLGPRPTSEYVYQNAECGGPVKNVQAEFIAQARAIAYLNQKLTPQNLGSGVTPDVQWELSLRNGRRPDILYYDHTVVGGVAELIEAKLTTNADYADIDTIQMPEYLGQLARLGMRVIRGSVLDRWGSYQDAFTLDVGVCSDGRTRILEPYSAMTEPSRPYVLAVIRGTRTKCPQDDDNQDDGHQAEAEEEIHNDDELSPPVHLPPVPPLPPVRPTKPNADEREPARTGGDPHVTTIDGLTYDLQAVGEFDFAVSAKAALNIQTRFVAAGANVSVVGAAATVVNGYEIEMRADGTLLIDGTSRTLEAGWSYDLGQGATLQNIAGTYYLTFPETGSATLSPMLSWQPRGTSAAIGLDFPSGLGDLAGLVGNANGVVGDDLKMRDGTLLTVPASAQTLHGPYADSWRVSDANSIFTYGTGQSTGSFTDRSFPAQVLTLGDFTDAQQSQAASVCRQYAVATGPQFSDCMLDVLSTGNWTFAAMAAQITQPTIDPQDLVADSDGAVSVNFEGSTPNNFRPLRLGSDPAKGTFAGPFSGEEQYRFYVPALTSHDNARVRFDVMAIGDWKADSGAESVTLQVDGLGVWQSGDTSWTSTGRGTLATGQPYETFAVDISAEHLDPLLGVTLGATGVDAAAHEAFAIDNVRVTTRLVPAQAFDIDLRQPVSISAGQPALGAGNLESKASKDEYRFTLATAGQSIYLDMQACVAGWYGSWQLRDGADKSVAAGSCGAGDRRIDALPAGQYRLQIAPEQGFVGTYALQILQVPAQQIFDVSLPGPAHIPADTVQTGAGSLETKASADVYRFTVAGSDRSVKIEPTVCPRPQWQKLLAWTLQDQTGATVATGTCIGGAREVSSLKAGGYRLVVTPEAEATGAYELRVSQVGPDVTLAAKPDRRVKTTTADFILEPSIAKSTTECALDIPNASAPFTDCGPTVSYPNLADGQHTFWFRATDPAGNRGAASSYTFDVDTVAPTVTFTQKPPTVSNITGPAFSYVADKSSSFRCSLVAANQPDALADCGSQMVYRNLTHGDYRFVAEATDDVGNVGVARYAFSVDMEAPKVTLNPPANLATTTAPAFTFTASEAATFECSLVPSAQTDNTFASCPSPKAYTGLVDGQSYRFAVRATDIVGHTGTTWLTWTLRATPPTVTLTSKPTSGATSTAPSFAFTSSMSGARFECSLVTGGAAASFSACTSPMTYSGIAPGSKTFTVKAIDASGSWVSTSYTFTIAAATDTTAPTVPGAPQDALVKATLGADTAAPVKGTPVTLAWTSSTDAVGVTGYELYQSTGGGAYALIQTVTGTTATVVLAPGTSAYRFQVRAKDAAGNRSAFATGVSLTLTLDQESSARLAWVGTWTSSTLSGASAGSVKQASTSGATATYTLPTGSTKAAWVTTTGPGYGKAQVIVDGNTATALTVDLYAATTATRQIAFTINDLAAGSTHKVQIKVLGTKNTAATGTRVDMDAALAAS